MLDGASVSSPPPPTHEPLGVLDRFLSLWILLAAALGLACGQSHYAQRAIDRTTVGSTNLLVAAGLLLMMYPPLTKVQWNIVHRVFTNWKLLLLTLIQNWLVGPLVMFLLAALFFPHTPAYLAGLSLVGCARCIAMVVVWNAIAGGDQAYCAAIVAVNAILTIALYAPYARVLVNDLPMAVGLPASSITISIASVAENVGIYMGIPFVAAVVTWYGLRSWKGTHWYTTQFTPRLDAVTVVALLFTIVVLFASQSTRISADLGRVVYAFVPLLLYFVLMFGSTFVVARALGGGYAQCVTLAFTAASNNFELAMAIAIATFGLQSDLALMSVVGALMEIPTMLALVKLSLWLRVRLEWTEDEDALLPKASTFEAIETDDSTHSPVASSIDFAAVTVEDTVVAPRRSLR